MKRVGLCIFVLFLLILPAQAQGREPAQQQLIRLQAATFDPLADGEPIAAIGSRALENAGPYYIVQFKGPVEQAWVQQLEQLGAELLGYIPDNAHVARIQPADVEKVRRMYAVRWLGPYRPGYKLAPSLANQTRVADAQAVVDVYVAAFPGESLDMLRAFLTGLGATIEDAAESEIGSTFRVQVAFSALAQIAQHPAISWVEPYAPLKMDNSEGRRIMGVEQVWQNSGLFGAGQIVAISDSGLSVQGALSPDFGPAGRTATTKVHVTGLSQPELAVSPTSGQAGTTFSVTGSNFVPNDSAIEVRINGQSQGKFRSDAGGGVTFTVRTWSTTPPGTYTVQATDSAGGSASVDLVVTAVPGGSPTMTVAPAAGPPGSSFTFNGGGFAPSAAVGFSLDGQSIGQATADNAGRFKVTLNTNPTIPPAVYTLAATQGARRASAQFTITSGGGSPAPGGNGIYVTLAWTDPPAQANAAATLINNLDLRVVGPDGKTYLGNGGATPDVRNNVEGIRLERPAPGTYTIYVEAKNVDAVFGAQPYALIATTAQSFGANGTNAGLARKLYLPLGRR